EGVAGKSRAGGGEPFWFAGINGTRTHDGPGGGAGLERRVTGADCAGEYCAQARGDSVHEEFAACWHTRNRVRRKARFAVSQGQDTSLSFQWHAVSGVR